MNNMCKSCSKEKAVYKDNCRGCYIFFKIIVFFLIIGGIIVITLIIIDAVANIPWS